MGSIGRRPQINNIKEEPSLLGDVNDIIRLLKEKELINDCKVNIEGLIKDRGVNLIYDDTLSSNQSGYLRKIDNGWVIGVNKRHNTKRQRFTLAHEFAHFVLHKDDGNNSFEDEIFFRDDNLTSIEYAANEFAAAILMPQNLVEECINNDISDIEELANKFDVSVIAMKNRVVSLGYKLAYE